MASTDFVYGTFALRWYPSSTVLSRWRSEFRFAGAKLSARLASQRSGHLFAKASTSRHNHIAAASMLVGVLGEGGSCYCGSEFVGRARETKEFGRDCGKEASRFSPAGYSLSAALYMMS